MRILPVSSCLLVLSGLTLIAQTGSIRPDGLRCEYRVNPLGIDATHPRLSWYATPLRPAERGQKQTAYQVVVASSPEKLGADQGDLWDSGKVSAGDSIQIEYQGVALASRARAFWKVKVWDEKDQASPWSQPARWTMGLLTSSDWKGKWIGHDETSPYRDPESPFHLLKSAQWIWAAAPTTEEQLIQTTFELAKEKKVTKATAVIAAQDRFEFEFNGQHLGTGLSVHFPQEFDLAPYVQDGPNRIAIKTKAPRRSAMPPSVIAAIRIEFASGEPVLLVSNDTWKIGSAAGGASTNAAKVGDYGMAPLGEVGFEEERVLPARAVRKEFQLERKIAQATATVAGLGLFELYVNDARIGDDVLAPALSDYDKRIYYMTYDVTAHVKKGRNAVGVLLGNGRFWAPRVRVPIGSRSFGYPKLRMQIDIDYSDGSHEVIASDETWKLSTEGPIRANNEYDGEFYDATREQHGWAKHGFDDAKWQSAQLVDGPKGALVAQMAEPLKVMETMKPQSIKEVKPGRWIIDMGQNMVGWARLSVSGRKGARVQLRFAETLRPDGLLYLANLRSARATDTYILKGKGKEQWEPRFTYHGFRYIEVTGYPGKLRPEAIEGRVVHDAMSGMADFVSSNELLNRLHRNVYWGIRSNYRSIPTDCPQRDERQGWLGDRSVTSRSEAYMFDVAAFYSKWSLDIADSERDNGSVPDVAPNFWQIYTEDITWPSTFLLVPQMLYEEYGDTRAIERTYPAMRKWIEYMRTFLKDGLMPKDTYGDWCVPPERPDLIHSEDPARKTNGTLLATAYYYQMLRLMSRYAVIAGQKQDATEYDALAEEIKVAFNKHFFNATTGLYDNGTQTASILPLAVGMPAEEERGKLFDHLVNRIHTESKDHVGTGLIGAQWLMRTLTENGQPDLAYKIATQTTYPGWGYMIDQGATTVWELWNGNTADPAMNSGNHVMQIGDLGLWLYAYLAGIRSDPAAPGYRHAIIKPYPAGGLKSVSASHKSLYGRLASSWKREGNTFTLDVTVPANTTATVSLPAKSAETVTESAKPATAAPGIRYLRTEEGRALYEVSAGQYHFVSQL